MKNTFSRLGINPVGFPSLLAYGLVVAFYSLTPVDAAFVSIWDKLLHFICYGVFALLGWWASTAQKTFFILCGLIIIYSALMEVGQGFVPGRLMSGLDIVANAFGVAVVAVFYLLAQRYLRPTP